MKVIAKSAKGQEFLYSARSAHKVPTKRADEICEALNKVQYQLKDDEVWYIHEIDQYDTAYDYAEYQSFGFNKHGDLVERRK